MARDGGARAGMARDGGFVELLFSARPFLYLIVTYLSIKSVLFPHIEMVDAEVQRLAICSLINIH
jgi:hypothetical protein